MNPQLKRGTLELCVLAIVSTGDCYGYELVMYEKVVSNIQEIRSRSGRVISIVTEGDTAVKEMSDFSFEVPHVSEFLDPVICSIPLQLLSYHIAVCKGKNVDQPRNLAKSVTVE